MFKKITTILGLALMLTVAGVTASQVIQHNYTVASASETTCNTGKDLSAKISADNKSVTITNKSKDCSYEVGYASYEVHNWENEKFLKTQKLFDHASKTIKANTSVTLSIDLPTCSYQVDAFYGKVITKFSDDNMYSNRKLAADSNLKNGLCIVKPTPTPTPTQTPETPVVTVSTTCVANNPTITISWNKANRDAKGYHVNITSNDNFNNGGWSKEISKDVTTFTTSDFSGMSSFGSAPGNLTMKSDATYKVRIYYVATNSHSEVKTVSTQNCKPTTTPSPTPTPTTFTGVCVADKSNVGTGSTVTFTANANGGNGSYTYSWSGSDNLSGTSRSVSQTYWSAGDKTARVVITSGNKSVTADCSTSIWTGGTYNPTLSAVCVPGTQTATIGQTVKYTANATGGNGSYAYSWSGTDNVSSKVQNLITSYSTVGQKTATVTVISNGQSVTANCSTIVTASTTGGIYLSQVPYTGIGSNVRVFFFILALIGWSVVIGYVLIKRQASKNGMSVAEYFNGQRSPVLNTAGFQAPVVASTMTMARPVVSTPVAESYPSFASIADTKTPAQAIVDLLTRGEDQEVIVFIQNLQIQGQLVSDVITNVAMELDNVIKARTGIATNVDARISNSVAAWSNTEIAYSIGALVNALNQTSTSVYTASKIALIKIAEIAKVKNLA